MWHRACYGRSQSSVVPLKRGVHRRYWCHHLPATAFIKSPQSGSSEETDLLQPKLRTLGDLAPARAVLVIGLEGPVQSLVRRSRQRPSPFVQTAAGL